MVSAARKSQPDRRRRPRVSLPRRRAFDFRRQNRELSIMMEEEDRSPLARSLARAKLHLKW